ncbi:helix-turn-helix domain-containing protein [Riemerella anatipestifer]|uniref:AraC family transcriptional regulator n=2 Tax=Riemerella anatipestifer TaxID=34085 RepID=A0AAP6HFC8_RIEAN|nr:AraC family transcriptional regulator [Riemerella anatipestifer]MBT0552563.1 helix-turn-helix transcriptional regulator [Riemerella anatipestifer]MBT0554867.1 helix-turn-helix transcriptional regulator [Riemerella anatipestifer]MCO7355269.1 AraC family transcriptional regulator [Riemerella anatipestifer]MCU7540514.1 AraC family transcriptional regulator [Riemerella anatipestifer]MCU7543428.1 AraC family transcriptional regulator [Riemerella anatipestifer]
MRIIKFPDELNIESSQNIQIFDYYSSREIVKQQIMLYLNTFSFLIEGNKEVVFGDSTLSVDTSKFLIMKSGHCLMTERLSDIQNYRSILLFFSNEILSKFILKYHLNRNELYQYKSVYSFKYDEFIQRFVNSLLDISKLSKNAQKIMLELKFEEIMLYLMEIYGTEFLYSLSEKSDDISQKFVQTVEMNRINKLTLKELAFLCNMSISTFKREFGKHYAETPMKWFQNKRLEYAHHLLYKEQKTPSEIYLEVGYKNLSSFIQAYKLKYGVTPKQHYKD